MNRQLQQFQFSSVKMLTLIDCRVSVGAAGAVSSSSGNLVLSVTHVSTGIYQLNLKDNLNAFIGASYSMVGPTGTVSGILGIEAKSTSPSDMTSLSAPTFTIKCLDAAGALADPASGSIISVLIQGRNSSVAS